MVSRKSLMAQIDAIVAPFDKLGVQGQKTALKLCDRYSRKLKSNFEHDISSLKSSPLYTNAFTVMPETKDMLGVYGCKIWNRRYPLSHLLEHGHGVYNQFGGPYEIKRGKNKGKDITVAYEEWNPIEDELFAAFEIAVEALVDEALKSK